MTENRLVSVSDLFGNSRWFKPDPIASKPVSERSVLLRFFNDQKFTDKKGVVLSKAYMGVRLAHIKTPDLYALKRRYEDRMKNIETAHKFWWKETETKPV